MNMNVPNLVILSNGCRTAAIVNGAVISKGIEALDFKAEGGNAVLRLMDIDIEKAEVTVGATEIDKVFRELSHISENQGKN